MRPGGLPGYGCFRRMTPLRIMQQIQSIVAESPCKPHLERTGGSMWKEYMPFRLSDSRNCVFCRQRKYWITLGGPSGGRAIAVATPAFEPGEAFFQRINARRQRVVLA